MNVNDNGCPFCNEFNGRKELSYFEIMFGSKFQIEERCLFETNLFACVPSIGSFVEGYLLIIPKKHFLSSLLFPDEYLYELMKINTVLSRFYEEYYHSGFLIYEHGTSDASHVGGMSVVHAHLHYVPYNLPIISMCPEFSFAKFENFFDVSRYYASLPLNHPYLLLQDVDGSIYLAFSDDIPSQFFRKRVCDICGLTGQGDWKIYPFVENIKKTISAAQKYGLREMIHKEILQ